MTQASIVLPAPDARSTEPSLRRTGSDRLERPGAGADDRGREAVSSGLKPDRPRRRLPVWVPAIGGALLPAAAYLYVPSLYVVETDDASFQTDTIPIVPKVAAYVSALHVTDNSAFQAGELLVELDPRDFQAAVDIAAANLQSAQAAQAVAEAQLSQQSQVIAAGEANVEGDRGTQAFAAQQLTRFQALAKDGFGTTERWQQAQSDTTTQQAILQRDTATLAAARGQVDVLQSQVEQAKANTTQAQAALAQAKLNLSYTKIDAPSAGTVASRSVQVGNFVQPGQTLFSAVPNEIYVIANFKETELTRMRAGQPVSINVDAFPNHPLHGHIDSFQRGTGSNFALLPPENATGNFVKIVQRVPVKILLDDAGQDSRLLGPGMSVEATVTVRAPPRWLSRLL
jgi:membrane fusion protein (multidrug efflux system)